MFSPTTDDPRLLRQREALSGAESGASERDLRVEHLTGGAAAEARDRYEVEPGEFAVLLIGRDGGVKHRYPEPVSPEELFARIDEMPMRRREMQETQNTQGRQEERERGDA